ncbi:MAG: ArsR/SmtB family transcription factor [Nitrosotalea sp.]
MAGNDDEEPDRVVSPEEYIEVISTEDERIKVIGEELANDTGRAIFGTISQGIASSNELSKALGISLPLVNWHINRLLSVGLIRVEKVEMSQKNKQMKYYGPVKTALVIIPPENLSADRLAISKKETILKKLRHYMAAIASSVVGFSGIYLAEKSQTQQEASYVPEMTPKAAPPAAMMHATIQAAPSTAQTPYQVQSAVAGELVMILFALLGAAAIFCAVFFAMRLYGSRNKKSKQISG